MNVDYDIAQWIRLSDMDLSSAEHLFELHKPTPCEIVCFHSQQAVEKIIKGYLFSKNIEAPKIHDLRELCDMCLEIELGFGAFGREMTTLTQYGVLPRYPAEIGLTEYEAEQAIKYAKRIIEFVKSLLKGG